MHAYLRAIWICRYFWLSLVKMDLRARYRGSVLGIGWSLLQPIAMTVIQCAVFVKVFHQDIKTYTPFLFTGMTFWNYWTAVTTQGCRCFFLGEAYIRQYPAPMAIYPLRVTLGSAFHFVIGLGLVLVLGGWCCGVPGPLALLSLLPAIALLILFGWAAAALFGLATVRFRDTHHLTEVGMQALYFLTPVMYPPSLLEGRRLGHLMEYNPLVPFLKLLREPIIAGRPADLATYGLACLVVAVLLVLAALALRFDERRLIFNL
jgi:ABC-type polysaccharide/polyol phosphate export permease